MRFLAPSLILLAALTGVGFAATCPTTGSAPELFVPYFTVDMAHGAAGETTLTAVTNTGPNDVLLRTDIYSVHGDWVGAWHQPVVSGATYTVNLRDIMSSGQYVCFPHIPYLSPEYLASHLAAEPGHLSGYAVLHVVTSPCSTVAPDDPSVIFDHTAKLVGDLLSVEPGDNFAEGQSMPSVLAPGRHLVRFASHGGAFDGSTFDILRLGGEGNLLPITARNEAGDVVTVGIDFVGGLRPTTAARVDLDKQIGPNTQFGSMEFDCGSLPCAVSVTFRADGRFAARVPGAPLDCDP